ncbi:MAG: hypothetical protein N3E51_04345 [Candidatus Micrarchaeota archaeon]|nr:hypothetical protein [Candidatus Micrarchaeota archaeon]
MLPAQKDDGKAKQTTVPYQEVSLFLGNTEVVIRIYRKAGTEGVLFIHPHGDESGALEAGLRFVEEHGGTLVTISRVGSQEHKKRKISFEICGKAIEVDPNRIFSEQGIRSQLAPYGDDVADSAFSEVKKFSESLILEISRFALPSTVIALHNDRLGYSQVLGSSGEARISPGEPNTDFFFVTRREDFERLASLGYNAFLQSGSPKDDGSASVLFQKLGVRYINVECGFSKKEKNYQMVLAALGM